MVLEMDDKLLRQTSSTRLVMASVNSIQDININKEMVCSKVMTPSMGFNNLRRSRGFNKYLLDWLTRMKQKEFSFTNTSEASQNSTAHFTA